MGHRGVAAFSSAAYRAPPCDDRQHAPDGRPRDKQPVRNDGAMQPYPPPPGVFCRQVRECTQMVRGPC